MNILVNGVGCFVYDIVLLAKKNYKLRYKFSKKRKGDLEYIVANTDKIKKKLKWKPKFNSILKMIKSTIEWEKNL